jgi:cytoskeletal protein CcmA (bactofilin family)
VTGKGSLRVEGQFKGELVVSGAADVGDRGSLEGNVQAQAVDVSGTLLGDVTASGLIAIRSGALVRGELKGAEISIEPGARVSIRIDSDIEIATPARR